MGWGPVGWRDAIKAPAAGPGKHPLAAFGAVNEAGLTALARRLGALSLSFVIPEGARQRPAPGSTRRSVLHPIALALTDPRIDNRRQHRICNHRHLRTAAARFGILADRPGNLRDDDRIEATSEER